MKIFKKIWIGAKELPDLGPHPGTDIVVGLAIVSALAGGVIDGMSGVFTYSLFTTFMAIPAWIVMAIDRYETYMRDKSRVHVKN